MWNRGDLIAGQYEVREVFTSGGMGDVYRIHHRDWDMPLALKRPRMAPSSAETIVSAFRRECEIWAKLNLHPHVVTCYYVRTIADVPCVLTEFVDGGSLRDWIQSQRLYAGTVEAALARILDISIQSAWGLEHSHAAGLVHQDVKPGNILLTADGTAKITDFGLAKVANEANSVGKAHCVLSPSVRVSVDGMTPAYCSPEQAKKGRVSYSTDIYSWAVSVLEMFRGEVTWANGPVARYVLQETKDEPPAAIMPEMPEAVCDLLSQCMEESPNSRPTAFSEIADRLQEIFLYVFTEPHGRLRPDTAIAEADSLNNRALSMLDLGRPEDAEKLFNTILVRDPVHPEALFNLSLLRLNLGQVTNSEALGIIAEIIKHEPNMWVSWFLLAQMQIKVHMRSQALQSIDEALVRVSDISACQAITGWKRRIVCGESVNVPYAVAKPRSGDDYYEELRKFERLCAKMQRALTTGQRKAACRYLQQAQDLESFRRHPKLKALAAKIGGN